MNEIILFDNCNSNIFLKVIIINSNLIGPSVNEDYSKKDVLS